MALDTTTQVTMPAMGESVTEGTVLEWHKQEGDPVEVDEVLVEISTDKVDAEVPAPAAGVLVKIHVPEGESVQVGQLLAEIGTNGASAPSAAPEAPEAAPEAPAEAAATDLSTIKGTGPRGRITKADVLGNGDAPAPRGAGQETKGATAAPAAAKAEPLRGGAAMLARYMDESRAIPTATSFRTMTVTTLDGRRKQLKEAGQRVSFTHLIAYAIARAATEQMPVMAHHFEARDGKPFRIDDGQVNLGIAVDVEKKDGSRTLMVPVIRDAGRLTFAEFLDAYNALAEKARTNSLTADGISGANLSLTNPGGLGTAASVPRRIARPGTVGAPGRIAY